MASPCTRAPTSAISDAPTSTELAALIRDEFGPAIEYNIEGYPTPQFVALIGEVRPDQVTLVPDAPDQRTSDHGWDLAREGRALESIIAELQARAARASACSGPRAGAVAGVSEVGADRIELYTGPYAHAFGRPACQGAARALRPDAEAAAAGRARASTPATTSISTTCRLSCRRSRSSPRSVSATRSPPTRCASAFPPQSRPTCGRSGVSATRRTRRERALRSRQPVDESGRCRRPGSAPEQGRAHLLR